MQTHWGGQFFGHDFQGPLQFHLLFQILFLSHLHPVKNQPFPSGAYPIPYQFSADACAGPSSQNAPQQQAHTHSPLYIYMATYEVPIL